MSQKSASMHRYVRVTRFISIKVAAELRVKCHSLRETLDMQFRDVKLILPKRVPMPRYVHITRAILNNAVNRERSLL